MTEPTITCAKCGNVIKLTESLAAPLIESTRCEFEQRLAQKDADIAKREETLKQQVAEKLKSERTRISAEEAEKAKLAMGTDLEQRAKEVAELREVLKQQNTKLAKAQSAQAELVRKTRELDDAKREMELTVERRIQAALETSHKHTEEQLQAKEKQIAALKAKETDIANREEALSKARESMEAEVAEKVKSERARIVAEESRKAKLALGTELEQKAKELSETQELLKQREGKLAEAQKAQADLIRKERELEDAKREMALTVEKRVQEGLGSVRDQARKEADEQYKLKVAEKELTISSIQKQMEEWKRKAEQGSQQLQGEVQELDLEALLKSNFPRDTVEPVPKGEHGGDILHRVLSPVGQACGTILWESKRTKNWSDGWLAKLRDDQRAAKAEIAVIVSQNLPKGVETFDLVDGVWVTHPRAAVPVAMALRQTLIEVGLVRQASEGQQTKMDLVYHYLTGPRFRQRLEAIVEGFSSMKADLDKERKAILKQWAKREEQIGQVMQAAVGMYGDLQGIAGKTLQEIAGLELPALEAAASTTTETSGK